MSGGSIKNVTIKSRLFPVAADSDCSYWLGGYTNELQANGDRTARVIKTATLWGAEGLVLSLNPARADLEFLQEVANSTEVVEMSLTLVDDTTYEGMGQITGDLKGSTQNSTVPISLGGGGELSQQ